MQLDESILEQYGSAVTGGIGSFSQMGFLDAEMATSALEKVQGRTRSRTPSGSGTMVVAQACTDISNADPQIAAYRKIAGS
jgi:hypothetical protein